MDAARPSSKGALIAYTGDSPANRHTSGMISKANTDSILERREAVILGTPFDGLSPPSVHAAPSPNLNRKYGLKRSLETVYIDYYTKN